MCTKVYFDTKLKICDLLLWIVCRICENTWVNPPNHSICTLNDYSVFVGLKEFVVKKGPPNSMK